MILVNDDRPVSLKVPASTTLQSEVFESFELPKTATTFSVRTGSHGGGSGHAGYKMTTEMADTDANWNDQ